MKPSSASWLSRFHAWMLQILVLSVAAICIGWVSHYLYRQAEEETLANMSVIAHLKALEVERWLEDKRNTLIQPSSGYLAEALVKWQEAPESQERDQRTRDSLIFYLRRHPEATRIELYDASGRFLLGSAASPKSMLKHKLDMTPTMDGKARLIDFYLDASGHPHLAFATPLFKEGGRLLGFMAMETDPNRFLYPYIQTWPGKSASARTVLFRNRGGLVEYLSPLPEEDIRPLDRRAPPEKEQRIPSPPRERGYAAPGFDQRGRPLLRAIYPVKGADWYVSVRMLQEEAFAGARRDSLFFFTFILTLLSCLYLLNKFFREKISKEAKLAQKIHDAALLRDVIDAVPESMILLDAENRIELINEAGARRLHKEPEDLLGLDPLDTLPPGLTETRGQMLAQVRRTGAPLAFNDKRAGMELLNNIYPTHEGQKLVIVSTDITQRNADARAQREATQTLQGFIDHLPGLAFVKDQNSRVLMASRQFQELLGIAPESMVGKLSNEIFPGEFGIKMVEDDKRILAEGKIETISEVFEGRHYDSTKFVIPRENSPSVLGGITLDVTSRILAEQALRESEALLRSLSEHLPESYLYRVAVHEDGTRQFLYVSGGVERIHGVGPEAILNNPEAMYGLIDASQRAELFAQEISCQERFSNFHARVRMRRADGSWGWMSLRSHPQKDPSGSVIWDGVATDVTQIVESEQKLALLAKRSEALLQLPIQAERLDESDFMAYAQECAEKITKSHIAFIHFVHADQDQIELVAWSKKTLETYCKATFEKHYPLSQAGLWAEAARQKSAMIINDYANASHKKGLPQGHAPLERLIVVPVIEAGKVRMLAGVGNKEADYSETDLETVQLIANETWRIVQKRRAEQALEQTVQVIEASPTVCIRWGLEEGWPVRFVSDNIRRWGYEPEDLVAGKPPFVKLIHPEDLDRIANEVYDYLEKGASDYVQEYRLIQANSEVIWVSDITSVICDDQGQAIELYGVITDISEHKHHELELAKNLATQQELNRKLEEAHSQLLQAEKLSEIGQLAAGVAHELNNPIGFVSSNLGTLREYVNALVNLCDSYTTLIEDQQTDSPQIAEIRRIKQDQDYNYLRADVFPLLEESREGLSRMRKIVQDLRDFSRTGDQGWEVADLHKGLDSTLNIVANELKYKCSVRKEYGNIPEVLCIISQLNQVFMNLLVNAAQAMETPGVITLKSGMQDAQHVWLSISDTGQGIKPEHLNHIFDPFFTTKPVGIGTGLGLSLVFGIINRHHGHIEVSSQPGQGTTFRIVLPIHPVETTSSSPVQEAS